MKASYPVLNCRVSKTYNKYGRKLRGVQIKLSKQEIEQREILPLFNDNNRHDLNEMYKSSI